MTSPFIPFSAAAEHLPGLAAGQLVRHGAILKDIGTGQIVGHLQETGLLSGFLSEGIGLVGKAINPLDSVASIFTVVQNQQIKSQLDVLTASITGMQTLQLATLATSIVGIGVTMASTAIILSKIKQLDQSIQRLEDKVDALPAKWVEMGMRNTIADLQTSLGRLDEATDRPDQDQALKQIEQKLDYDFNQFANGVESITGEVVIDADQLGILLSALSICAGAQFKALLMLDLKEAAQKRAARQSKRIGELTWGIPQDILATRLGENRDQALAITNIASELRVRLAGRPHLLQSLITREIHGRDYIECAQQEKDEPLLVLVS